MSNNRTFKDCPFTIRLPEISNITDNTFSLDLTIKRKNNSNTKREIIKLSNIIFWDTNGASHLVSIENRFLSSDKSRLKISVEIAIKSNLINYNNLPLQIIIFTQSAKYEVSYFLHLHNNSKLSNVTSTKNTIEEKNSFPIWDQSNQKSSISIKPSDNPASSKEKNLIDSLPILSKYKDAVFREMYSLKENGGRKYKVINGHYLDERNNYFCYSFDVESELFLSDDSPLTITAAGNEAKGYVTSCDGLQIVISIDKYFGKFISSALLSVEPWKLLQVLGNKINNLKQSNTIAVKLAKEGPALATNQSAQYIPKGQDEVLKHVENHDITIVWGPPGTGKTYTMSTIAQRALQQKKTVLIVSHSNISVDGLIKATEERLHENHMESFLSDGKVLRYGNVRDKELIKNNDVVSFNYTLRQLPEEKSRMMKLNNEKKKLLSNKNFYSSKRKDIEDELRSIRKTIHREEEKYVNHAQIVATTISKVLVDPLFEGKLFDIVMFDEISMAYVPQIIVAASFAREHFMGVGDFRQLAPIAQSEAKKTLCTDLFSYLGINKNNIIYAHPWLVMLNEQRRMHPGISDFPNQFIYQKLLSNHKSVLTKHNKIVNNSPIPGKSIQLINLARTYCAADKNNDNSHFNILSALISFGIALQAEQSGEKSIGIITPYAAQARLIRAMIYDNNKEISCSTVHQFQGSERNIIVFDAVESYPAKRAGILLSKNENNNVTRLINVAITRARGKFITVANAKFWEMKFRKTNNIYWNLIKYLRGKKQIIEVDEKNSLQKFIYSLNFGNKIKLYRNETSKDKQLKEEQLIKDINSANHTIIISLPEGEYHSNTNIIDKIIKAKKRGVQIVCKAFNIDCVPNDLKNYTWKSNDATFPLLQIDNTTIWYNPFDFNAKFVDKDWRFATDFRLTFRINGKRTIDMIYSLADLEHRSMNQSKIKLHAKQGNRNNDAELSGMAAYVKNNIKCEVCGQPMMLKRGFKSHKVYLQCSSCDHTAILNKDDVNNYILLKNVTCPEHPGARLHAAVGRYGLYVICDSGHTLNPDEI